MFFRRGGLKRRVFHVFPTRRGLKRYRPRNILNEIVVPKVFEAQQGLKRRRLRVYADSISGFLTIPPAKLRGLNADQLMEHTGKIIRKPMIK